MNTTIEKEPVAYMDSVGVCAITLHMIKELESRSGDFPYHMWPTKLYTAPPQPQTVKEALEQAAKICDENAIKYELSIDSVGELIAFESAAMIRALIQKGK